MSFNVLHSRVSERPLRFSNVNQAVLQKQSIELKNINELNNFTFWTIWLTVVTHLLL